MENELTQEEIIFIKDLYKDSTKVESQELRKGVALSNAISEARSAVGEQYKEKLEQAEGEERKQLIEQLTLEANQAEEQVRATFIP